MGSLASAAIKSEETNLKLFQQSLQSDESCTIEEQMGFRARLSSDYECYANKTLTNEFGYLPPSQPEVESRFWSYMFGVDNPPKKVETSLPVLGSAFTQVKDFGPPNDWNMARLHNHPASFLQHFCSTVATPPWCPQVFYRMVFSHVPWASSAIGEIHYVHSGSGTTWYSVPASAEKDLESAKESSPGLLSPQQLRSYGVPVFKICQHAGDFVVVAPHAHTFVLSHGFEIMESAGIGLREWIDRPLRANPQIPIKFAICKEAELVKKMDLSDSASEVIRQAHTGLLTSIQSDLIALSPWVVTTQCMPQITHLLQHFYGPRCTICGHYCYLAWVQPQNSSSNELCVKCALEECDLDQEYKAIVSLKLSSFECNAEEDKSLCLLRDPDLKTFNFPYDNVDVDHGQMGSGWESSSGRFIQSARRCFQLNHLSLEAHSSNGNCHKKVSEPHAQEHDSDVRENLTAIDSHENQCTNVEEHPESESINPPGNHPSVSCSWLETKSISNSWEESDKGCMDMNDIDCQGLLSELQSTPSLHDHDSHCFEGPGKVYAPGDQSGVLSETLSLALYNLPTSCPEQDSPGSPKKDSQELLEVGHEVSLPGTKQASPKLHPVAPTGIPDKFFQGMPVVVHHGNVQEHSPQEPSGVVAIPGVPCSLPVVSPIALDMLPFSSEIIKPDTLKEADSTTSRLLKQLPATNSAAQAQAASQGSALYKEHSLLDVGQAIVDQQFAGGEECALTISSGFDSSSCPQIPRVSLCGGGADFGIGDVSTNSILDLEVRDVPTIDGLKRRILYSTSSATPKFVLAADVLPAINPDPQIKVPLNLVHLIVDGIFRYADFIATKEGMPTSSELQWAQIGDEKHLVLSQNDIQVVGLVLAKENNTHSHLSEFVRGIWDNELLDYTAIINEWRRGLRCISAQLSK